jgi:hypothetical protein
VPSLGGTGLALAGALTRRHVIVARGGRMACIVPGSATPSFPRRGTTSSDECSVYAPSRLSQAACGKVSLSGAPMKMGRK